MDSNEPARPDARGASGAIGAPIEGTAGSAGPASAASAASGHDVATGERVAMIADAAGIGLWAREIDTGALYWSASNRMLYGLAAEQTLPSWSEYLAAFVHPEDRDRFVTEVARADDEGRPLKHTDYRVRTADGRERWIYSWSSREMRGGVRYAFGVNVDVTDRHVAEIERREREQAEQARRAQSALLARVSHELRTPMNAVLGFADLLAVDAGTALTEVQAYYVEHIRAAGRHLLALIDDLLGLASADAQERTPDWQAVALATTTAQAMDWVRALADGRGLRLEVEQPLDGVVRADARWLLQVATNLLTNAVKYNRPGGWVRVATAERINDGRRQRALVVADSGRGFDAAQRLRLFEPFERLGAETEGIAGIGIGLAIVRRLVERLDGEITLESTPGVGSEFRVWLPESQDQPVAPPTMTGSRPDTGPLPLNVLCIEDNPVNRELVAALVSLRPGVTLRLAADGASGLAMATDEPPDLVLLDVQLPDMHGTEVLRRLRADTRLDACVIIGLSANASPEDIRSALDAGCEDYWTKPIDYKQFLAGIDALAARRARSAHAVASRKTAGVSGLARPTEPGG